MITYTKATPAQVQTILRYAKDQGTKLPTQEQIDSWDFDKAASLIGWYRDRAARLAPTYLMTPEQEARARRDVGLDPVPAAPARRAETDVPAGRYAVHMDGDSNELSFFKVDRPEEGKWAGWTFVKHLASDTEYPVKGARKHRILEAIAADIEGALATYGREIGACGMCGKTLTNDESRAYGIGPDCRKKL